MNFLIISSSLNPESKSALLAQNAYELIEKKGQSVELIDLRKLPLSVCGGFDSYEDVNAQALAQKIKKADGLILATPIYNYGISASAKNVLELTSDSWGKKVVGFLCAAGGKRSYMALMPFASSLMIDCSCIIVPDFVYAEGSDFDQNDITNGDIHKRLEKLCEDLIAFTNCFKALE